MSVSLAIVPKKTVESLMNRIAFRAWSAQPPLSKCSSCVTLRLEHFRHGELALGDGSLSLGLYFSVVADEGVPRMFARHEDATGWSAYGVTGIVARKTHALGRQLVKARRLDLLLSVTSKLGVTKIVGHDVNNIRLAGQEATHSYQKGKNNKVKYIHASLVA